MSVSAQSAGSISAQFAEKIILKPVKKNMGTTFHQNREKQYGNIQKWKK
jgi:hypothetical protein